MHSYAISFPVDGEIRYDTDCVLKWSRVNVLKSREYKHLGHRSRSSVCLDSHCDDVKAWQLDAPLSSNNHGACLSGVPDIRQCFGQYLVTTIALDIGCENEHRYTFWIYSTVQWTSLSFLLEIIPLPDSSLGQRISFLSIATMCSSLIFCC